MRLLLTVLLLQLFIAARAVSANKGNMPSCAARAIPDFRVTLRNSRGTNIEFEYIAAASHSYSDSFIHFCAAQSVLCVDCLRTLEELDARLCGESSDTTTGQKQNHEYKAMDDVIKRLQSRPEADGGFGGTSWTSWEKRRQVEHQFSFTYFYEGAERSMDGSLSFLVDDPTAMKRSALRWCTNRNLPRAEVSLDVLSYMESTRVRYEEELRHSHARERLEFLLKALARTRNETLHVVQIGAHVGDTNNDPMWPLLRMQPGWRALLVEPVPHLFQQLSANYAGLVHQGRITLENSAVCEPSLPLHQRNSDQRWYAKNFFSIPPEVAQEINERLQLLPEWSGIDIRHGASQIGGIDGVVIRKHLDKYFSHEPDLVAGWMARSEVPVHCVTYGGLLARHRVRRVDYLRTDTEGYDGMILQMALGPEARAAMPSIICFESEHLGTRNVESLLASILAMYTCERFDASDMCCYHKYFLSQV